MSVDTELDMWREQWQSETAVPPDLRRKVERESRFMKLAVISELLVTIVFGGYTAAWAVRAPEPDVIVLALGTWMSLAAAWAFRISVSRGNWSPSAIHTGAFIDLSIRRCRGTLAAINFAAGLFVCQTVFCLSWVYHHSPAQRPTVAVWLFFSSTTIDFVWISTIAFFSWLVWFRRKKRAELAYLLNMGVQAKGAPTK
jgi:hypothetical protein